MCLRKHKNEEQITSDDVAKLNYTNKVGHTNYKLPLISKMLILYIKKMLVLAQCTNVKCAFRLWKKQ